MPATASACVTFQIIKQCPVSRKTVVPEHVLIWFWNGHSLEAPLNYLHWRNFHCMVPAVLSEQNTGSLSNEDAFVNEK